MGRTIALAQRENAALAIAEHLHFDVTAARNPALQKHAGITKTTRCKALRSFERCRQFSRIMASLQTDTATAGGALQHDRKADASCLSLCCGQIADEME